VKTIYLDYNATTPVDPEVVEAILPYLTQHFGNPASSHSYGTNPKRALETAREQIATLLGCESGEILFTSGASESSNAALKGIASAYRNRGNHIITSQIEHPATLAPLFFLQKQEIDVTYLPVDHTGTVDPDAVRRAITAQTILISIMHANNEVGTIQPVKDIGKIAGDHEVLFHTDAAQSAGKIPLDVQDMNADLLSMTGHKLYAPKGVGALYIRSGVKWEPLIHGAGQESSRRAGTENVAYAVGLGKACALAFSRLQKFENEIRILRDWFQNQLITAFGDRIKVNGHPRNRLPNTLHVSFVGTAGSDVLERVPQIAASTGAACHAGSVELSSVLKAMGISPEEGMGAVRFSLGKFTTREEVETAVNLLTAALL